MAKRGRRTWLANLTRFLIAVAAVWVVQLLILGWFFQKIGWTDYWWWRSLYRPGLRVYSWLLGDVLHRKYFDPLDRTGATVGFSFAAMVYAFFAVWIAWSIRKLMK